MIIDLPDGSKAEFPDDMAPDQIESVLKQQFPAQQSYETAGGPISDWTNLGGQVPASTPEQESQVSKTWDRIGANVQAGYAGVMELGSSLAKIADSIGIAPKGTAQAAQSSFEEAEKIYQQGQYPETAVSRFAGSMIPAAATTYGMVPGAASLGSLLGTAGRYAGSAVGGAAAGAVTGGLMNTVGQSPENLINEQGAIEGAALGALLGPAGQLLSKYGQNTAAYGAGKEELRTAGYKGPVMARDFGDESIAKFKSTWMDNIIDTGVRNEQYAEITPAIKSVLGSILDRTEQQGANQIGKVIRGVNKKLENQSDLKWQQLFSSAKEQGVSRIETNLTKQAASDFLEKYGTYLNKDDFNLMSTLARSKQVSFEALNKIKGKGIWNMSEKFSKMEGSLRERPITDEIAKSLKDMYWNITDDIGNALKDKPELSTAWEQARAFTTGVKDIFNVDNNRKLVNAIGDVDEKTGQLKTFINSVLKPVSGKASQYYSKALGSHYQKAISDQSFRSAFDSSLDIGTGDLNLSKFFNAIETANDSNLLNNPTVQALGGLEKYFQKIQVAKQSARESNVATQIRRAMPLVQTGAVTTAAMTGGLPAAAGTAAAVFGAPAILGFISKNSPIKNSLIGISKLVGKNEKSVEYLMGKVGNYLAQAGVVINENPEGITVGRTK